MLREVTARIHYCSFKMAAANLLHRVLMFVIFLPWPISSMKAKDNYCKVNSSKVENMMLVMLLTCEHFKAAPENCVLLIIFFKLSNIHR